MNPCPKCEAKVEFKHMHSTAYGMESTHMAGSERFECPECGHTLSRDEAKACGLVYVLDK